MQSSYAINFVPEFKPGYADANRLLSAGDKLIQVPVKTAIQRVNAKPTDWPELIIFDGILVLR
jgi:hypothetical protein